ncbi:hypothetical protein MSR1_08910 [Magnetospirillum gryphiswaldense MSR-1]|nr:hypothetical protein MSR1_08910 [Magnetospirillum gryphiswaldense MSR-1]AVM77297.1 hypothetical protein MSR1L_08910 [Magnetospirillum gryphiswaldense]
MTKLYKFTGGKAAVKFHNPFDEKQGFLIEFVRHLLALP